jgi:hypothetical protein
LGVAVRTVQRWINDEFAIPFETWAKLGRLCRQRGGILEKIGRNLEADLGRDSEAFCRKAEEILGAHWQEELCRRLVSPETGQSLNPRTVQRWANGLMPIPPGVWNELLDMQA